MSENDLPASWTRASLSALGTWSGGGTPSKSEPSFWNGSIPWVSPKDMKTEFVSDTEDHITPKAIEHSATRLIPAESVLVVTRSGILERTLPVATTKKPVTINQDLKALMPCDGVRARYVALGLKAFEQRILKDCTKSGTTVANVEFASFLRFEMPLAPTGEQDRIIAEIDKQFTRLDSGVNALKRVQAQLKRYRASVLKAACEGRLVPTEAELARREKRDYEPADKLLARILKERRARWEADQLAKMKAAGKLPKDDKWKSKYVEPESPDTSALPPLPSGWVWATLEQIAADEPNSITDGPFGSNLKSEHYVESGPRVVRLQNIGEGRFLDERAHISRDHFERLRKHRVYPGDLVIAAMGERPPRACLIPGSLGDAIVKADCIRFKPDATLAQSSYLVAALNSETTRALLSDKVHGVGRPRLNLGEIRSIAIPLPPQQEQLRIIEEIEDHFSMIDASAVSVQAGLIRAAHLRRSILRLAFEGKLAPQSPKDEPASKLLERISSSVENKPAPKMKATR